MARRRRSRARENPGAGFWIAAGVGVVAVGGVIYVMTRPSTASAATTPSPQINPPTNDAATFRAPVTLTTTVNGRSNSEQYTPNPANLANDMHQAQLLANVGHGAGKEGEVWAARAKADGANQAQLAQLLHDGYAV